ncbi:MAG: FMN-binding protein [Limnochordia bacterium]|nr:hypothetical protein [Bacillota bacterium]HOB09647.1 hypothetical protein [Limnochordia bacterium]NLH31739.1 hypothetical protein [Bacillota bacterium]HPT93315.1 hypothetical protein [Limnochordia bacterium]HPZ31637.1 hypothetical protein [Limnochordia bacterium]
MNRMWIAVVVVALILAGAWYFNRQSSAISYKDGTYEGKSATDERGNYGVIQIKIEGGRITDADYVEYDAGGNPKGSEYPWPQAIEAIPKYEARLVETQDPDRVDNITEATGTGEKFREAAKNALKSADKR